MPIVDPEDAKYVSVVPSKMTKAEIEAHERANLEESHKFETYINAGLKPTFQGILNLAKSEIMQLS